MEMHAQSYCGREGRARRGASSTVFVVLFAVASLLLGGTYYFMSGSATKATDILLTDVARRGPFEHVVLEQGEVESSKNVEILCEVESRNSSGTAVLWVVPEGTQVKVGDKLVELDSSALTQELKQQRIIVNSAQAAKIAGESALEQAKVALEEYLEGTFAQEEKLILSEILVAEEKMSRSRETAKYSERLAALGFQTTLQLKADQFAVEQAQVELDLAQGKLKTLREITKKKMLIQFNADVETAQAQVEAATNSYQEEMEKLNDIQRQIEKCIILAPEAGVVIHANKTSSRGNAEFVLEAGSLVRERQVLIRLPDPSKMQIRANINEARVPLVKEKMPVAIRVGAFEDTPLRGIVTKVNKYAEPTSWFSSQVKEYATYVQILDPPPGIRSGMTAEVRIFVEQLPNELQIPVQALYDLKGHFFCLIKKGEALETREVMIGAVNDKTVVILDGIEAGEEVVLNPRTHEDKLVLPDLPDKPKTSPGLPPEFGEQPPAEDRGPEGDPNGNPPASSSDERQRDSAATTEGLNQRVQSLLTKYDKNGDGRLSLAELTSTPSEESVKLQVADRNGDGLVDRQELARSLREAEGTPDKPETEVGGGS